jgi:hypothetical protein
MGCELVVLLADIHANTAAWGAVMRDAARRYPTYDGGCWFLGDLFGRGPAPVETWRLYQLYQPLAAVPGNHDWGVLGRLQTVETASGWDGAFDPASDWQAILSHRRALTRVGLLTCDASGQPQMGEVFALADLPLVHSPQPGVYLIHGGADRPLDDGWDEGLSAYALRHWIWGYVKTPVHAEHTFDLLRRLLTSTTPPLNLRIGGGPLTQPSVVIVGHYHRRLLYCGGARPHWEDRVRLDAEYKLDPTPAQPILISPGSVGYPREIPPDPAASYAVLALEDGAVRSVTFYAVPYGPDQN